MIRDLLEAAGFLAPIGAGVALLWLLGRDQDVDEHTVDDYRPDPVDAATADVDAVLDVVGPPVRRRLRPRAALDVLPPAPPGMDAGSPLYAETLFRTWHPDTPEVVAARMLREIAAERDDVVWTVPATDRDMTGAFPVAAVA